MFDYKQPILYTYGEVNFLGVDLSKRIMKQMIIDGIVDDFDDPRLPTIQGVLNRGLLVESLKQFMYALGFSKNVIKMEWDKIWAINRGKIDPITPRYACVDTTAVVFDLTNDPTAHAEILALRDAARVLGTWRLTECTLVVTLEPCVMCAGALMNARIGTLVYATADLKGGATASLYNVCTDPRLNHQPKVMHGICEREATDLMKSFFADKR
jgi:tRNA(adenine34) deaminase